MARMDWKESWLELFRETFEGVAPGANGTYYVQGKEALIPILNGLTAEQASHRTEKTNSVAAHARHTAYYVSLMNKLNRGEEVVPDWEGSWTVQEVTKDQWDAIRKDLKDQFTELHGAMKTGFENLDDESRTYALAQLAHAAFHLGSIRQLAATL